MTTTKRFALARIHAKLARVDRSIDALTEDLERARAATSAAIERWQTGGSIDAVQVAADRELGAERMLSRALEQETAAELDWSLACDPGAPIPHVFSDGHVVLLSYYVRDSALAHRHDVDLSAGDGIALVRFTGCMAYRLGPPNDEAISGHPLRGRGLRAYGAHLVERSSWIAELEKRNRVHPYHKPDVFFSLRHYLLTFHDETFECLARDHAMELRTGTPRSVLVAAISELVL
jgi:hypothetical protein